MKYIIIVILAFAAIPCLSQKTTRKTISSTRGIMITQTITEETTGAVDTLFLLMGQNGQYTHITDIVMVHHGTANDINDLLSECMKFIPEDQGTSLEFKGNTLMSMGNKRIMLFGTGRDSRDYVMIAPAIITKLQTDLKPYLK